MNVTIRTSLLALSAATAWLATAACSDTSREDDLASDSIDSVVVGNGTFRIQNACNGMFVDVSGASTADGADIIAWTGTGAANQRFKLAAASGSYTIVSESSGKNLDVSGAGTADGTAIIQWAGHGGANQKFVFKALADGTYEVSPSNASTKRLTVSGTAAGSKLQIAAPNGSCSQKFLLLAATGTTPPAPTSTGTTTPTPTATGTTPVPTPVTHDFVEEFNTPISLGAWPNNGNAPSAYPKFLTYPDGTAGKYYPSQVLSVHDGVLDYYNHDAKAAAVLPFGYEGFTYGTYSVRMRLAATYSGYHNAFLLWPNTGTWPQAGEFDYPENETSATKPYAAVVQTNGTFLPPTTTYTPSSWTDGKFHDYTIQWAPGEVRFYQDGVFVTKVNGNVPSKPMHPVMQNEFTNTIQDPAKPSTSITGHTYVDRVTYDKSYTITP